MGITEFTKKSDHADVGSFGDHEILKYVKDERILRALLESGIFKLREIQKEAIIKGLYFKSSFPHFIKNVGQTEAKCLCVTSPVVL